MNLFVVVDVPDVERAIRFYEAALGLHVYQRYGEGFVELHGAQVPIHLLQKDAGSQTANSTRTYERHWTPLHLDFVTDDLDAAVERALKAGAKLERPIVDGKWGRMANLSDPFGHGFCVIQFLGRGYDELLTNRRDDQP